MSLAHDLLSVLNGWRVRVAERVNSGQLLTVDNHLQRLAAAAETDVQRADAEAHSVLDELYTALHATTSGAAPAAEPTPAAPVVPAAPAVTEPVPAPAAPAAPAGGTTVAKPAAAG
jgi:hypothetical protein